MKKKNLIMGTVRSYPYKKIKPFVDTLKKTTFEGDIVLFVSEISKKTQRALENKGIKLRWFANNSPKHLIKGKTNYDISIDNKNIPLMSYRFLLYEDFLKKNSDIYEKIFICDVGDLVFQKSPFEDMDISGRLCAFLDSKKIKDTHSEYAKIPRRNAESKISWYLNQKVSCAGTIMGDIDNMQKYLSKMKNLMNEGNDQSIHNYIVYYNKVKGIKAYNNGKGILTLSDKSIFDKIANIEGGKVLNKSGETINVIHQYDRSPLLLNMFGGKKQNKLVEEIKERDCIRKTFSKIKEALFSIPLAGRLIRKGYKKIS